MSNTTPRLDILDGEVWCAICGCDLVEGACPPCDEVFKDAAPDPMAAMEEADSGGWDAFEGEDQDD